MHIWFKFRIGNSMAEADCLVVWPNSGSLVVSRRYSSGQYSPTPFSTQNVALVSNMSSVSGSTMTAVFTRPKSAQITNEQSITGSQAWIWAYSSSSVGSSSKCVLQSVRLVGIVVTSNDNFNTVRLVFLSTRGGTAAHLIQTSFQPLQTRQQLDRIRTRRLRVVVVPLRPSPLEAQQATIKCWYVFRLHNTDLFRSFIQLDDVDCASWNHHVHRMGYIVTFCSYRRQVLQGHVGCLVV